MKRTLSILVLAVGGGALAWWLFGSRTDRLGPYSITRQRIFGRTLLLKADWNGDGRTDDVWRYTWDHPFIQHEHPRVIEADKNFDGRFDTWIYPLDRNSALTHARYEVDLDGDGVKDWTFMENLASGDGMRRIQQRRGY